jgi:Protein of unknown function (DUF3467)
MATKKQPKPKGQRKNPPKEQALTKASSETTIVTKKAPDYVTVKVDYVIPDDLLALYSDVFFIQHTENDFTISFAQVQQPVGLLDEDYDRIDTIKGKVVARIVLTPRRMAELIQSLQINWNLFRSRFVSKPEDGK